MDFNEWYDKRGVLPKIPNYHKNLMEYLVQLKKVFDEQNVNDGMKQMYIKKNDEDEITNLYFFYDNKMTNVILNAIVVTMENLFYKDLKKVIYECELESKYGKRLVLNFISSEIILEPESDADYELTELDDYNENLKKIYQLIK
jgi:hypothetical protein